MTTAKDPRFFHRDDLAQKLTTQIMAVSPGLPPDSGLFLTAPRRTGKSTFVREDLRPALETAGAIVIYTDLWEDQEADPAKLIIAAIRAELAQRDGVIKRIAQNAGLDKVNIGGMSFSLDRVGLGGDITIAAALSALSDETKKPIALIVDEAQHAITTPDGATTLFALKAARDEINSSRHFGLHIVATGSNQDKLAMLRNSKDQAFFGAYVYAFPHMGKEYVDWFCKNQPFGANLDTNVVMTLFEKASFRPEILGAAAKKIQFDFDLKNTEIPSRFAQEVDNEIRLLDEHALGVIHSLTPIQYAVLKVMADSGKEYAPFESITMNQYQSVLDQRAGGNAVKNDVKIDVTNVQQALIALQDKRLVWRETRGVYALEDTNTVRLLSLNDDVPPPAGATGSRRPE